MDKNISDKKEFELYANSFGDTYSNERSAYRALDKYLEEKKKYESFNRRRYS